MIFKNQIPISLFVLLLALIYVNCTVYVSRDASKAGNKSCIMQGINGYMFLGPLLNAEDLEPLQLKGKDLKKFNSLCPNLKSRGMVFKLNFIFY